MSNDVQITQFQVLFSSGAKRFWGHGWTVTGLHNVSNVIAYNSFNHISTFKFSHTLLLLNILLDISRNL